MNPEEFVFTERYRPSLVSELVGDFKLKILKYMKEPKSMPHFIFYSKTPGTGKTSLAKAIINELGCDSLILNSSDDRKIDVIREKVKNFVRTQSSNDMRRCVFLDEFDGMLRASQDALRNLMETYANNAFFILTCNNINKVIDALKSRCIMIPFAYPDKEEVYKYLEIICKNEQMEYTEKGLYELIGKTYPSIRNGVLALQDLKTEGKTVSIENITAVNEIYDEMWTELEAKNWKEIKTQVLQSTVDPRELNTFFWTHFLMKSDLKGLQICCRNERDFANGADPKVIFVTSVIELCK